MSPDFDDVALEEALRGDLPSAQTSARLRRRLLAAGVAVGNGVAATTAAAAGSAAPAGGVVAKGLALSWGVKLGALAAVTIPAVSLVVESSLAPEPAPAVGPAAAAVATRVPVERTASRRAPPSGVAPIPVPQAAAPAPEPQAKVGRTPSEPAARVQVEPTAPARGPSQASFGEPQAPPSGQSPSTLAEETRLLDGAFAALSAGDTARAAALIAEHQRRFPDGLLQQERVRAQARVNEMNRGE